MAIAIKQIVQRIKVWHIVMAAAFIYIANLNNIILPSVPDSSEYILAGKTLLEKEGLKQFFLANTTIYYRLLSILLLPFLVLAPDNFLAMKSISILSSLLSIIVINEFFKDKLKEEQRKMALMLFAFNGWVVEYSVLILTEMPYLFFSMCVLLFIDKYSDKKGKGYLLLSLLFLALSFYTRPNGLILLLSLLTVKKIRSNAVIVGFFILLILCPLLLSKNNIFYPIFRHFVVAYQHHPGALEGVNWWSIPYRMGYNFCAYIGNYLPDLMFRPIVEAVWPRLANGAVNPVFYIKFLLGALLGGVVLAGFVISLRERAKLHHWYAFLSFLFLIFITVYVARYLLPVLPFIFLYLFYGLDHLEEKISQKLSYLPFKIKLANFAFLLLFLVSCAGSLLEAAKTRRGYLPLFEANVIESNDWVKNNTPEGAIILSHNQFFTKLFTGRETVPSPNSKGLEEEYQYLIQNKVDYAIIGGHWKVEERKKEFFFTFSRSYPERFILLFESAQAPKVYIYKILR